jgi:hypothetical protein
MKRCMQDFMTDPLYYITLLVSTLLMVALLAGFFVSVINFVGSTI